MHNCHNIKVNQLKLGDINLSIDNKEVIVNQFYLFCANKTDKRQKQDNPEKANGCA